MLGSDILLAQYVARRCSMRRALRRICDARQEVRIFKNMEA